MKTEVIHCSIVPCRCRPIKVTMGAVTALPTPVYEGSYVIIPETHDVTLPVQDKKMRNNLEVTAIPMHNVSNDAGGITMIIGGVRNG